MPMATHDALLADIAEQPDEAAPRLVYADWLEEHGDARGEFVRLHLALRGLSPDQLYRPEVEEELSRLRKGLDCGWLAVVEPERAHLYADSPSRPHCQCFRGLYEGRQKGEVAFHLEPQDTECD